MRQLAASEGTVVSNVILGRDDQIGCPLFSPIDEAERRLVGRKAVGREYPEDAGSRVQA
jgi:hypothetical protein